MKLAEFILLHHKTFTFPSQCVGSLFRDDN